MIIIDWRAKKDNKTEAKEVKLKPKKTSDQVALGSHNINIET